MAALDGRLYFAGSNFINSSDTVQYFAEWIGGTSTDTCIYQPIGITHPHSAPALNLSPNPTSGEFNLSIPTEVPSTCTIHVYDALGQQVKEVRVHLKPGENKVALDLSGYAKGMYMVRVEREGRSAFGKVVLE